MQRKVRESIDRCAVALLGWCCWGGIVGLAFFGAVMKGAVATVDMPRIFWGGGGTSGRAAGGRAAVLVGRRFWRRMMETMDVPLRCWGGRAACPKRFARIFTSIDC